MTESATTNGCSYVANIYSLSGSMSPFGTGRVMSQIKMQALLFPRASSIFRAGGSTMRLKTEHCCRFVQKHSTKRNGNAWAALQRRASNGVLPDRIEHRCVWVRDHWHFWLPNDCRHKV